MKHCATVGAARLDDVPNRGALLAALGSEEEATPRASLAVLFDGRSRLATPTGAVIARRSSMRRGALARVFVFGVDRDRRRGILLLQFGSAKQQRASTSTAAKLELWRMLKGPADRAICHPALISECLLASPLCSIVPWTAAT